MSYQIKRLRCPALTAGLAGRNFPSTIYAQSSIWGPAAATLASTGPPSGAAAQKAAKAGAISHLTPNRLSWRAAMHYAAALRTDSRHSRTGEPGEIMRPGWPVLDPDKRKPLNGGNARRPTRAILIGWLLRPRQNGETRGPCGRDHGSLPTHALAVSPGHSTAPPRKLMGRKEKQIAWPHAFYVVSGLTTSERGLWRRNHWGPQAK